MAENPSIGPICRNCQKAEVREDSDGACPACGWRDPEFATRRKLWSMNPNALRLKAKRQAKAKPSPPAESPHAEPQMTWIKYVMFIMSVCVIYVGAVWLMHKGPLEAMIYSVGLAAIWYIVGVLKTNG